MMNYMEYNRRRRMNSHDFLRAYFRVLTPNHLDFQTRLSKKLPKGVIGWLISIGLPQAIPDVRKI